MFSQACVKIYVHGGGCMAGQMAMAADVTHANAMQCAYSTICTLFKFILQMDPNKYNLPAPGSGFGSGNVPNFVFGINKIPYRKEADM